MEYISQKYTKSYGVYMIQNLLNGRFYIGASNCVYQRVLNHMSELRRNRSGHKLLQEDWLEYGEESFVFIQLDTCDSKEEMNKQEELWLRKAKVETSDVAYNQTYRVYKNKK
jgi:group I intron endonuclease